MTAPTPPFDRRLVPARADLAAEHLRGVVEAARYVAGTPRRVVAPVADVRRDPRPDCPIDTQAIRGETVTVYDETEGWAWGQLDRDGYVGWLSSDHLGPLDPEPTHQVVALRTLVYPGPDLRFPILGQLTEGARVAVVGTTTTRSLDYGRLADGTSVVLKHLAPLDAPLEPDFVAVAARYLGTPYQWGGRTSLGIDCSGLVQTALARAGVAAPRDSDMQEAALGAPLPWEGDVAALRRGDLVFWKGHVAMVAGEGMLLHATGHFMTTVVEPIAEAIARTAAAGHPVTSVRRM